MTLDYISNQVAKIKRKYDEHNPSRLASAMGIAVDYVDMGDFPKACKGFFIVHKRQKHITINNALSENIQSIILIHEIGHAVLHYEKASCAAFHDFVLFDSANQMEYEANIFAAEFLLSDEDVLSVLNEDIFFFEAAKILRVPPELLDFKFRLMKRKGYKLIDPPISSTGDFLKNIY